MMGTQKEIQDLDFLCTVIDAFLGDSDSSGLGENQPRLPSPFLFLFLFLARQPPLGGIIGRWKASCAVA